MRFHAWLVANQSIIHQYLAAAGDTYWVQGQNAPTPLSGSTVAINDTSPTADHYNLTLIEVLPSTAGGGSGGGASTYTISGTISPSSSGAGSTVTLTGAASMAVTADSSGSYSFTGLPNGSYTITPSKSGFTFSPTSLSATVNGANLTGQNFAATASAPQAYSISGTISPATSGAGTLLTLSGAASATTISDLPVTTASVDFRQDLRIDTVQVWVHIQIVQVHRHDKHQQSNR